MIRVVVISILVACAVVSLYNVYSVKGIRVCPTLRDYDWSFNSRCHDNTMSNQNISEVIRTWGFVAEEHYLTTEDGYMILVERVYSKITKKTPIIGVHGIATNAISWVYRGNLSLAYALAKQGYDVWLVNYRGTWYSKGHVKLSTRDDEYWKYSINDMGVYDIRSAVEYVNKMTREKAVYIGYSMGTTGFFIYSTTYPEETAKYVKGMIGVAPLINFKDTKSIISLTAPVWPSLKPWVYSLWHGEILANFSKLLLPLTQFSFGIKTIQVVVNALFGDDWGQVDAMNYPVFITYMLDTTGAEAYTHYVQIYQAGVFQNYDHGREENLKRYGTPIPPPYNMSKVSVPVTLFVANNDWLATPTNAKQIYSEIPEASRCGYRVIPFEKWNHVDYLVGKDVQMYFYDDLLRAVQRIVSKKCSP